MSSGPAARVWSCSSHSLRMVHRSLTQDCHHREKVKSRPQFFTRGKRQPNSKKIFFAKAVAFLKVSPTAPTAPRNRLPDAAYAGNGQSSFFTCASSHFPPSCARNPAELFGPWQPRLPRLLEHEYTSIARKGDAVARLSHAQRRRRRLRVLLRCLLRGCRPLGPGGR